jgi:hypothetical protein
MADPDAKNFRIQIDLNYITDKNAIIKYNSTFGGTYSGAFSWVKIDWEAQTDKNLLGYNVYFSAFPLLKYKANTTTMIPVGTTTFQFELPLYPQNIAFYFWVSKIVQTGVDIHNNPITQETILNDDGEGQTTYTSSEYNTFTTNTIDTNTQFYDTENIFEDFEMILRRMKDDRKMELQMKGMPCDVYMRKWGTSAPYGTICVCSEDKTDPDFMGSTRCPICFGTGVIGGYYEKMEMFISFPLHPGKTFNGFVKGLTISQTYDGWTIVPPFLRAQDLVVRKMDGQRWIIGDVNCTWFRGAAITQFFSLNLIQQTDIRYIVSNNTIATALDTLKDPRFNTPSRENF